MALDFVSSFLAARQAHKKEQAAQKQQEIENTQNAAYLALAQAPEDRTAKDYTQQQTATKQMESWDSANPQPSADDPSKTYAWAAKRATQARKLGLYDEANKTLSDYRTGESARALGSQVDVNASKTNLNNANVDLVKARTSWETAHAANEKNLFQHQLAMLDTRTRAQVVMTQAHVRAMLEAQSMRSGTQRDVAQLNNTARDAISMRAALLSIRNHDANAALQQALTEYRGQEQQAIAKIHANASTESMGMPAAYADIPQPQMPQVQMPAMPAFNISVNGGSGGGMDPATEAMLFAAMTKTGVGGSSSAAPAPAGQPRQDLHVLVDAIPNYLRSGVSRQKITEAAIRKGYSPQEVEHAFAIAGVPHGAHHPAAPARPLAPQSPDAWLHSQLGF